MALLAPQAPQQVLQQAHYHVEREERPQAQLVLEEHRAQALVEPQVPQNLDQAQPRQVEAPQLGKLIASHFEEQ